MVELVALRFLNTRPKGKWVGQKGPASGAATLSLKTLMGDLASGHRYGIFIDDTGSPGAELTESGPHPGRASWVGVVIPPFQMPGVLEQMPGAIQELKKFAGAAEFHCKDVFQGRGQFKNINTRVRLDSRG